MHSQQALLVRAGSKEQAIDKAKEFLERFRDDVWDWYQFGGRRAWSEAYQDAMSDLTVPTRTGRAWRDGPSARKGFELRKVVDNAPLTEAISAEESQFFYRLQEALERTEAEGRMAAVCEAEEEDADERSQWSHVTRSLAAGDIYDAFVGFFDVMRGRSDFPDALEAELWRSPREWYLVNVDIHW